jgi:hypothetical protein
MTGDAWQIQIKDIQVQMVFLHLIWNDASGLFGTLANLKNY